MPAVVALQLLSLQTINQRCSLAGIPAGYARQPLQALGVAWLNADPSLPNNQLNRHVLSCVVILAGFPRQAPQAQLGP
jgi:hypothetical protein